MPLPEVPLDDFKSMCAESCPRPSGMLVVDGFIACAMKHANSGVCGTSEGAKRLGPMYESTAKGSDGAEYTRVFYQYAVGKIGPARKASGIEPGYIH